jgi:hypothetical protein
MSTLGDLTSDVVGDNAETGEQSLNSNLTAQAPTPAPASEEPIADFRRDPRGTTTEQEAMFAKFESKFYSQIFGS